MKTKCSVDGCISGVLIPPEDRENVEYFEDLFLHADELTEAVRFLCNTGLIKQGKYEVAVVCSHDNPDYLRVVESYWHRATEYSSSNVIVVKADGNAVLISSNHESATSDSIGFEVIQNSSRATYLVGRDAGAIHILDLLRMVHEKRRGTSLS